MSVMYDNIVYTIGYAPHDLKTFVDALEAHRVTAVVDVRSSPYSQFKSEFNRESLKDHLKSFSIEYVFLGDLCGARIEDPACYTAGKVDFDLVAKSKDFQTGLTRIFNGMKKYRIAIMCAEKDPLTCHRTILICRNLLSYNIEVNHILANADLESHKDSEHRLLKMHKLHHPDMFFTETQRLDTAYKKQGEKIAYEESDPNR